MVRALRRIDESRRVPLLAADAYDVAHDTNSPWLGVGAGMVGGFGVGIQTFKPSAGPNSVDNMIDKYIQRSNPTTSVDKMIDKYLSSK